MVYRYAGGGKKINSILEKDARTNKAGRVLPSKYRRASPYERIISFLLR